MAVVFLPQLDQEMMGQELAKRYRIVEVLAQGEFGTVCLADDPNLRRRVMVKLFRLHQGRLMGREIMGRETQSAVPAEEAFLHRARCVAQLKHPSIVPIFDFGRHEEGPQQTSLFLVMPVLGAVPLAEELAAGRLTLGELLDITAQVAEALDHCASQGVSHGDVRPENIVLRRDDHGLRVWLRDFAAVVGGAAEEGRRDLLALDQLFREAVAGVADQETSPVVMERLLRLVPEAPQCGGRKFAAAVRRQRESLGVCAEAPSSKRGERPPDVPLVGRGVEMASLLQHLQGALRGTCQWALVGGEPGCGKSRLLRELAARGRDRQWRVLSGRFEGGSGSPYQGFGELVLDAFLQVGRGEWQGGPPRWADPGAELPTFFPELDEVVEVGDPLENSLRASAVPPVVNGMERFFELLARTLIRIADQRPTLFLLEDLHHSELAATALSYLVRRLGSIPTMLVATYRPQKLPRSHQLTRVLREARSDPRCCSLVLGPLSAAAHGELLASLCGGPVPPDRARQLYEYSGGSPLFLHELVLSLDQDGRRELMKSGEWEPLSRFFSPCPVAVVDAVERSLAPLPQVSRRVLEAASTLDTCFAASDLEALLMGLEVADDCVTLLSRAGFLEVVERDLLRFSSGLLRQVISSGLAHGERKRLRHHHRELVAARQAGRRERAVRMRANLSGGPLEAHEI